MCCKLTRKNGAMHFLLLGLAAYRVTRMITTDSILDRPRSLWFRRFPPPGDWQTVDREGNPLTIPRRAHPLGKLVECPWCTGFWVAGLATAVAGRGSGIEGFVLGWLGTATIVGLCAAMAGD